MQYDDLTLYFKNNLESPSLDFVWTDEDSKKFFEFMRENAPTAFLTKKENLLVIKDAFTLYFQHVGYVLLKINVNQIKLKIFPYHIEPEQSKNISKIINIIDNNPDLVIREYKEKSDQIYLKGELRDEICNFTKTIKDEKVNTRELARFSVRQALELKNEDLIMLKRDCIFVKLCDKLKKNEVSQNLKNTILNRYNGLSEEEMFDFKKEHFDLKSDIEIETFFIITANIFVEKYFLKKSISNTEYEKIVFPSIQKIVMKQLIQKFDNCEDFFKGFAGFIFRLHFEEIFSNIADILLHQLSDSDENIKDFLKYYSLGIVVINNKKYKVPALETDGLRWNVVTMLTIVKVYMRANSKIVLLLEDIDDKDAHIVSSFVDGLSPVEYNSKIDKEQKKMIDLLFQYETKLERVYDSIQIAKSEKEKNRLVDEVDRIKKQMKEFRDEKNTLKKKLFQRNILNNFMNLEKEVTSLNRELEKEKKILEQNKNSYISIKNALVKALVSKKKLVQI